MKTHTTWALSFALLLGCADSPSPGACSEATLDCEEQSDGGEECWAHEPGWEASAQATTLEQISAAENAGTIIPFADDPDCWELPGVGSVCVHKTSCSLLVGRPLQEVTIAPNACDVAGPWDYTAADAHHCLGVFKQLAVRLEPTHP